MKIKELILELIKYDPESEVMITLPPGWYKEEDERDEKKYQEGDWSLDSVDFIAEGDLEGEYLRPSGEKIEKIIAFCPLTEEEFRKYRIY